MTPRQDEHQNERHARAETRLDHLESLTSVLFKKLEELPEKIGSVISEKLQHHESIEHERHMRFIEDQKKLETIVANGQKQIEELQKWQDKIKNWWSAIIVFVAAASAFLKWLAELLFASH